jgi:hypothetical protein
VLRIIFISEWTESRSQWVQTRSTSSLPLSHVTRLFPNIVPCCVCFYVVISINYGYGDSTTMLVLRGVAFRWRDRCSGGTWIWHTIQVKFKSLSRRMVSCPWPRDKATYAENGESFLVGVCLRSITMGPIVCPWDLISVKEYPPVRAYCEWLIYIFLPFLGWPMDGVIGICPSGTTNGGGFFCRWMQRIPGSLPQVQRVWELRFIGNCRNRITYFNEDLGELCWNKHFIRLLLVV